MERQNISCQGLENLPFISKKLKLLVIPSSDMRTSGARSRGREMKVVQFSVVCILMVCEFTFMRRNRRRKGGTETPQSYVQSKQEINNRNQSPHVKHLQPFLN